MITRKCFWNFISTKEVKHENTQVSGIWKAHSISHIRSFLRKYRDECIWGKIYGQVKQIVSATGLPYISTKHSVWCSINFPPRNWAGDGKKIKETPSHKILLNTQGVLLTFQHLDAQHNSWDFWRLFRVSTFNVDFHQVRKPPKNLSRRLFSPFFLHLHWIRIKIVRFFSLA